MRTMARISIPAEPGNRAITNGTIGKLMQNAAERWHPEAMYFTSVDGRRCAFLVFDLPDASDIPAFAEPFFHELEADVELSPAMNTEDLQRGLTQLS